MIARFCTSCGEALVDATSCARCGTEAAQACSNCGHAVPAGNRFCGSCGTLHAATRRLATTERREVTVVFVDATDYTATSSRLDSEEVYTFIDEAMALLADVVTGYEGTVDKFTGDGLLAVFGAPAAHEDDADRAVRAALDMQRVIRPLREKLKVQHGFEFRLRIGVHTGEVVAGRIGSTAHAEYTVIGDTVNLAARLQAAADPDSVFVSQSTYERTNFNFRFEQVPSLTLKGIPFPVTAYRVCGIGESSGRTRGLRNITAPLLGREEQLAQLREKFRQAASGPGRQVVFVTGEAGVGKTRLVQEFLAGVAESEATVHIGRCVPLTRVRPFSLIADVLRSVIGMRGDDTPAVQKQATQIFLAERGLAEAGVEPYLHMVLGLSERSSEERLEVFDDQMLQRQTHVALRRVLLSANPARPLIFTFDDVHWVDSVSCDFLRFLVQSTSDEPLLMIVVSRELDRSEDGCPLIGVAERREERLLEIPLAPLAEDECQELVAGYIPSDTPHGRELRQKIMARAEGNPLYVEELIGMLAQRGGLTGPPGKWEAIPGADNLLGDIPPTLRGLIITRFDSLSSDLRRVLQRAAIIGRSFPARVLQHLMPETDVSAALEELRGREFVIEESFGFDTGYSFRHALIQEAIHSTMLKRDRQGLHYQIAEAIETRGFWPVHERRQILAYHYAASDQPAKALPYLVTAAEQAARRHAYDVAVEHCQRALSILRVTSGPAMVEVYKIELLLARSLKFLGQFAETERILKASSTHLSAALATPEVTPGLISLYIEMLREMADVDVRRGHFDAAFQDLEEASLTAVQWNDAIEPSVKYAIAERIAWLRFQQGKLDEALRRADDVIRAIEKETDADPSILANLCNTLGGVLWQYGKLDAAEKQVRRSMSLYHQIGYLFGKANAQSNLGVLLAAQGRWSEAADCFQKADWIRREIGCSIGRTPNLLNLALLRISTGDHTNARRTLESALALSQQLGEVVEQAHALIRLAHLAVIEQRFDEAARHLEEIHAFEASLGTNDIVQFQLIAALVEANRSVDDAIVLAEKGWAIARKDGVPETESDSARILGTLYLRRGKGEQAEANLRTALDRSRTAGDPYREALALFELGNLYRLHLREKADDARQMLEESLRLFTRLGAAYDAERVSAVLSAG